MSEPITSRDNPLVKTVASFHKPKYRRAAGVLLCDGVKLCSEALQCGLPILHAFYTDSALDKHPDLVERLAEHADLCHLVAGHVMQKLSPSKTPQGVLCVCRGDFVGQLGADAVSAEGRYLLLDGVADPGNMGTVIRTAEALGVSAVIAGEGSADYLGEKVVRAAMGSLFRLPLYRVPTVHDAINLLHSAGVRVYGSALHADSQPVNDISFGPGSAVVIGSEGSGITQATALSCDALVHIPMAGGAESLNAASAASILLWEMMK